MTEQEKDKYRQAYKESFEARYSSAEALKINEERVAFNTLIEALKPAIFERGRIDVRFDDVRNIYYFPAASGKTLKELFKCILYKAAKTREKYPNAGHVRDFFRIVGLQSPCDITTELVARFVFQSYLEEGFKSTAFVTQTCFADVLDDLGDQYHKDGAIVIKVGEDVARFKFDPEEELQ